MPWNPEKYNQFKSIRYQPFFDLMQFISPDGIKNAVDLGCGTGEQTKILSEKFPAARFLGIDPSTEMLAKSSEWEDHNLRFKKGTVEDFIKSDTPQNFDLIFSNAALQWSDNHTDLFRGLISRLSDIGQLAVQMPMQRENLLNQLLLNLVQESPFTTYLKGWKRESPLLSIDEYAQLMFDNGLSRMQIIQKVYPIIADKPGDLYDFIAGSALIPYLERMNTAGQQLFIKTYQARIRRTFPKFPAIYAFKRLLLYGCKER